MDEIKEKTREEILSEKTDREIFIIGCRMEKMQEEYENAVRNKRWEKKRECYVNKDGEPVIRRSDIVHDDVLLVIPLSGEYYSSVEKDKTYKRRLDKIIRDAMTSSLRKRDEERMKKNVECMVNDLKKVAEKVKIEVVKEEDVKISEDVKETVTEEQKVEKAVNKEQQFDEMKKKEEKEEVKIERLNADVGDDAGDEKKKDADQTETAKNAEVPNH
ncbi:uncharacterized protein LOC110932479 [Helianthus annuus]|uniref:uncharacterized protein LOC110932479 n=1 Tax=Helianthus annuus TaxID=4232 RepID=UPI000B909F65|nr:uncharacterized protein LOC110932479 [Helianthus annuus]